MKINFAKAALIFTIGYLVSWLGGAVWDSGTLSVMTAICYSGAILASSERPSAP